MEALEAAFFARETAEVASDLLGQRVIAPTEHGDLCEVRIVETEAYLGPEDPGSHATRGPDSQAHRLWGPPGIAYVYVCYGIHQMLNVAAHQPGQVGAVLIRAGEAISGIETMRARRGVDEGARLADGPGKLAQALGIARGAHDGIDLTDTGGLHLAPGEAVPDEAVERTGRIGLSAGSELPLRFVDRRSPALSRPVEA